jgi:hypothetical protein
VCGADRLRARGRLGRSVRPDLPRFAELEAGNRQLAAKHLGGALLTEALGPIRGTALEGFAKLAVDEDPRRAMRLLAASAGLRERDGGRPPAWLRRKAAATRAQAEWLLDPIDAERAWDEGAGMTTGETLAYALGHQEPRDDDQLPPSESTSAA